MPAQRGSMWGPLPLPEFLTAQLDAHGFAPGEAQTCAAELRKVSGRAATASLFVDLGSCKFLEGDLDGAVAAWRQAITSEFDAAAARALLNMGLMYEHLHLFDRATSVLSSVAERDVAPHDVHAALALARCHRTTGETELATETVARIAASMIAERPQADELAEILLALGDLADEADRPDRAERSWRVAAAGPESEARRTAVSRLLELSLSQGHDDEFVELLANTDALGSVADAVLSRVSGLLRLGHEDRAHELLSALDSESLTSTERFRLVGLRIQLGQVNEAIDHLEIVLASSIPEIWQRAAFTLGELYHDYDMPEVAAEMFDRVGEHSDRYWAPKAALLRGDIYAEADNRSAAEALWAEAARSEIGAVRVSAERRLANDLGVEPDRVLDDAVLADDAGDVVLADDAGDVVLADDGVDVVLADDAGDVVLADDGVDVVLADDAGDVVLADDDGVSIEAADVARAADDVSATDADEVAGAADVADVEVDDAESEAGSEAEVEDDPAPVHERAQSLAASSELAERPEAEVIILADLEASAPISADEPTPASVRPVEPVVTVADDAAPTEQLVDTAPVETRPSHLSVVADAPLVVSLNELDDAEPDHAEPDHAEQDHTELDHTELDHTELDHTEPDHIEPDHTEPDHMGGPTPTSQPPSVFARLSDLDQPVALTDDTGTYFDEGLSATEEQVDATNPYAALAPKGYTPPAAPATNPYAELAPNFDDDFTPGADVEPGDWEAMLDDWPTSKSRRKRRRGDPSSAFSRYT